MLGDVGEGQGGELGAAQGGGVADQDQRGVPRRGRVVFGVETSDHGLDFGGERRRDASGWRDAAVAADPGEDVEHAGVARWAGMAGGAVVHRDRGEVPGDRPRRQPHAVEDLARGHSAGRVVVSGRAPRRGEVGQIQRHGQRVGGQGVEVHVDTPEPEAGPVLGVAAFGRRGPRPPGMPTGPHRELRQRRLPFRHLAAARRGRLAGLPLPRWRYVHVDLLPCPLSPCREARTRVRPGRSGAPGVTSD